MNGPAGLGQAVGRHPLSGQQDLNGPVDVLMIGQHRPGRLDLDAERAEGMRQHVVDLAGDAGALAEDVRLAAGGQQLLGLGEQRRGLLGLYPAAVHEPPEQQPDQRYRGYSRKTETWLEPSR